MLQVLDEVVYTLSNFLCFIYVGFGNQFQLSFITNYAFAFSIVFLDFNYKLKFMLNFLAGCYVESSYNQAY